MCLEGDTDLIVFESRYVMFFILYCPIVSFNSVNAGKTGFPPTIFLLAVTYFSKYANEPGS